MTNTEKQTKKYDSEGKAQVIYNKLLEDDPKTLSELLLNLSPEYSDDDDILTVEDWLEYFSEDSSNLGLLVEIAQNSTSLNIDDKYIRESIYYAGYKTSDNIIDLVDKDEAIEWITSALDDDSPYMDRYQGL